MQPTLVQVTRVTPSQLTLAPPPPHLSTSSPLSPQQSPPASGSSGSGSASGSELDLTGAQPRSPLISPIPEDDSRLEDIDPSDFTPPPGQSRLDTDLLEDTEFNLGGGLTPPQRQEPSDSPPGGGTAISPDFGESDSSSPPHSTVSLSPRQTSSTRRSRSTHSGAPSTRVSVPPATEEEEEEEEGGVEEEDQEELIHTKKRRCSVISISSTEEEDVQALPVPTSSRRTSLRSRPVLRLSLRLQHQQ